jgi:hypothetical protein
MAIVDHPIGAPDFNDLNHSKKLKTTVRYEVHFFISDDDSFLPITGSPGGISTN